MIRLRVSTLEDYRRCVETDYADEGALVDRLRRGQWEDGPANWQMQAGTAWHRLIADPEAETDEPPLTDVERERQLTEVGAYLASDPPDGAYDAARVTEENLLDCDLFQCGDYRFSGNALALARQHVGPGLCEVTARATMRAGGRTVLIEGTADHVHGLCLQDHKAKFSACDPRDYEPSLQWRFYLLIQGAASLRYNLFSFKEPGPDGFCELRDIVSFRFWRYPGLAADCSGWLERFLDWTDAAGLTGLLAGSKEAA